MWNPFRRGQKIEYRSGYLSDNQREKWNSNGFVVLESFFNDERIRQANAELDRFWSERRSPSNPFVIDVYDGVSSRRYLRDTEDDARNHVYKLNDAYLESKLTRDLCLDDRLASVLRELSQGPVSICNSLHFERGSEQPLHFDTYYMPPPHGGRLIVTSICLEDVHPDAGPVAYVPGSHALPPFFNNDGTRHVRDTIEHSLATDHVNELIAQHNLAQEFFLGRRGDVLIWHEQLYHGGSPIVDRDRTRRSLVTHYWRTAELDPALLEPHRTSHYLRRQHQPVAN